MAENTHSLLPIQHRSVVLKEFGNSSSISVDLVPVPIPKRNEVLIRVLAAGLNPADSMIRDGDFTAAVSADDLPTGLGFDISGTIEALGPEHKTFGKGDAVFALVAKPSGQAEYVIAQAEEIVPAPRTVDWTHAAAVPLAAITAWQGLFDYGNLVSGQTVLVHGGAGGIGHFAVQLAKFKGAKVYATCSGADLGFVRDLGADKAIDYKTERFEDVVEGVDLVLDLVGGETNERSYSVLKQGGTLVSTVQAPDDLKAGTHKINALPVFMAVPNASQLREIADLIDAGSVKITVSDTFPLDHVRQAQDRLAKGGVRGKIVIITA